MSATIISDPMLVTTPETQPTTNMTSTTTTTTTTTLISEVEFAKCECCGLTEECTQAYIETVRERCHGKWICGLCAEAVKDEIIRSTDQRLISTEEAMARHMNFCKKFVSSGPPSDPTLHLISAMRQILKRSLDSPRSTPTSPTISAKLSSSFQTYQL